MKTIIITGAGGHLGSVVTAYFLEKGYQVIATVSNSGSKSQMPAHKQLQVEAVDLSQEKETDAFIQKTIETYETIDAAMMLAGGFTAGKLEATNLQNIKDQQALNFETAYNIARPLYQHMQQKNNGRLVFIGARPALQAADGKNMLAYALSKSLLFKLADFINEDAKGKNIVATVVVPSTIDTAANRQSMPHANFNHWVKPEALAQILEFICSDKASALRETVFKVYNNS